MCNRRLRNVRGIERRTDRTMKAILCKALGSDGSYVVVVEAEDREVWVVGLKYDDNGKISRWHCERITFVGDSYYVS